MTALPGKELSFEDFKKEILNDYRTGYAGRQMSLIAREVLTDKFISVNFAEGKEIAQIAMAKQFKKGDWHSGYYFDHTFFMAAGLITPKDFFDLLYKGSGNELNPNNKETGLSNYYISRLINENDKRDNQSAITKNNSDISHPASQMPRLVGLALASKLFRNNTDLKQYTHLSNKGNEVAFATIDNKSTSEGYFFEAVNAAGVIQIPTAISVWDDKNPMSAPATIHTIKYSISKALKSFEKSRGDNTGILIYNCKGWDYPALCQIYEEGISKCRKNHIPVLFHIDELIRYTGSPDSEEALKWINKNDCLIRMREWIEQTHLASVKEIDDIEEAVLKEVEAAQKESFIEYMQTLKEDRDQLISIMASKNCVCTTEQQKIINESVTQLCGNIALNSKETISAARKILCNACSNCNNKEGLKKNIGIWLNDYLNKQREGLSINQIEEPLQSETKNNPVTPLYNELSKTVTGRDILHDNFDALLSSNPRLVILSNKTSRSGEMDQTLESIYNKNGIPRILDAGNRKNTIIGEGVGLVLRGLTPIVEIQNAEDILHSVQTLKDNTTALRHSSKNGQMSPLIIRAREQSREMNMNSASPVSIIINSLREIYICVPRNMTRCSGLYNTLLQGNKPALVIEPHNGYSLREIRPENPGKYLLPLGIPEILKEGSDVTLITYGSSIRKAMTAIEPLEKIGISVELIDIQTLLPFDINHTILESIKKTNRVVFFDEEISGGTIAFMMQKVLIEQDAYKHLKARPVASFKPCNNNNLLSSKKDYYNYPNAEDIYEAIYTLMNEGFPDKYPTF